MSRYSEVIQTFREVADALEELEQHPHGPPVSWDNDLERKVAGNACVQLAGGDRDKGIALWREVEQDHGGYVPAAAAKALIRASRATELVVPDAAPEVA